MARFWSGGMVVPWNQAARDIAVDRQLSLGDTARLLALLNLAAADAGIAVWDSKLYYNFWRPITAMTSRRLRSPASWRARSSALVAASAWPSAV